MFLKILIMIMHKKISENLLMILWIIAKSKENLTYLKKRNDTLNEHHTKINKSIEDQSSDM